MVYKRLIQRVFGSFGYKISKMYVSDPVIEADKTFMNIYELCKDYTMTSRERMYALYVSVKYFVSSGTLGDFVECGVWRGGNAMLIAYTLIHLGVFDRKIYLYDTFKGMAKPSIYDNNLVDDSMYAIKKWESLKRGNRNDWCFASLTDVKNNMISTGYPMNNFVFVKGLVEDTIPRIIPSRISILRLDTDFYESTKHELNYLYPLLVGGGVLIIDDYGTWGGSKKAVDEYFLKDHSILLVRVDSGCRIAIKPKVSKC